MSLGSLTGIPRMDWLFECLPSPAEVPPPCAYQWSSAAETLFWIFLEILAIARSLGYNCLEMGMKGEQ